MASMTRTMRRAATRKQARANKRVIAQRQNTINAAARFVQTQRILEKAS